MTDRGGIVTMLDLLDEAFRGAGSRRATRARPCSPNLASVGDDAWRALPSGAARSIESIALHVGACKIMYDDYAFGDGSLRFATPEVEPWGADGPAPRDGVVAWLETAHGALVDHVAALGDDAELDRPRDTNWGEPRPTRWIIAAMITHDAYHAGEINHLRSLLGRTIAGATSSWASGERRRPARLGAPELGRHPGRSGATGPTGRVPSGRASAGTAERPGREPHLRGARHVRRPDPRRQRRHPGDPRRRPVATRAWPTCGSRARSGGSRCRRAGHAYFALKDERNQLQCVWFRDDRLRSAFEAQAGLRVVAHGRIDLFEPQGALQLYVESIQPAGLGDLALRFEALKARLAAEGLFDAARKRPLPARPATIAVITSPTGAVWKDICHVLGRRWPMTRVVLVAAQVQGEAAPKSLVAAFRKVERYAAERAAAGRPDDAPAVTILARGGGSLEDLWAFNDERSCGPWSPTRSRSSAASGTRSTSRSPTSPPTSARRRRPPRPRSSSRTGPSSWPRPCRRPAARRRGRRRGSARVAREVAAERRALDRLSPVAQLASARERVGLLLDRGTRAVDGAVAARRATTERLAVRLGPTLPARLARDRVRLDAPMPSIRWRSGASPLPGRRSGRPPRRSRSSVPRRRSSAATPSSGARTTGGSCATRTRPRPGPARDPRGARRGAGHGRRAMTRAPTAPMDTLIPVASSSAFVAIVASSGSGLVCSSPHASTG